MHSSHVPADNYRSVTMIDGPLHVIRLVFQSCAHETIMMEEPM
jgi:hypothetical protein